MKRITLFIALLCSISAFSATRYLVELGTVGQATWRSAGANEVKVNLNTLSKTLTTWSSGQAMTSGDEIWIAAGSYVTSNFVVKADISVYGSFAGTETLVSQRPNMSGNAWNFGTNQTIICQTTTNTVRGVTSTISTGLTYIDGIQISGFNGYAGADGAGLVIQANVVVQNCIIRDNIYTGTGGNALKGAGVAIFGNGQLLNSYIYGNQNLQGASSNAATCGGILVCGNSGTVIRGCTIEGNKATVNGGGLFLYYNAASSNNGGGLIEDCIITNNQAVQGAGGGIGSATSTSSANYIFRNCTIKDNSSKTYGGGAHIDLTGNSKTISIEGCSFIGNSISGSVSTDGFGAALNINGGIMNPIKNCIFRDNISTAALSGQTTDKGYIFHSAVVATMQNCLFANNTALGTGTSIARFNLAGSKVLNCTFARNLTNGSGRALNLGGVASTATNNIFWGNLAGNAGLGGVTTGAGVVNVLTYNATDGTAVTGGTSTTISNNINTLNSTSNNTFVSPTTFLGVSTDATTKSQVANADWSLKSGCLAINTGADLSASPTLITTDILGNARPTGASAVDIGAYEYGYLTQTFSFGFIDTKTYGDAAFNPGAIGGLSGNPVTYTSSNTAVATVSGNTVTIVGKGSTIITASQAGNSTYSPVTGVRQQLIVNAKALTITANSANKTYGSTQTTPVTGSSAFTPTGLVGSETIGSVTLTYGTGASAATDAAGNTSTITPSLATGGTFNSGNYAITYATGTLTVAQKALTIPDAVALNKVYNGTNAAVVSGTLTGIVGSDAVTCTTGTFASVNVGNDIAVTCVLSGAKATNYSLTQPGITANITPASAPNTGGNITALGISAQDLPNTNLSVSSGELVINQTTTVNSVTVAPGAKLTLSSSTPLTATNGITLQSSVSGTATLVDNYNAPTVTATVQQYLPQGRNWYVASPIETNIAATGNLTAAGATSVSFYSEELGWQNNYTGNLIAGVGYVAVSAAGGGTNNASFNGKLNSGDVAVTLTKKGSTYAGYNLVANPYPSYMNPMGAINANTNLVPTIWYRTKGATYKFETVNTASGVGTDNAGTGTVTGYIPPMQAFWVKTTVDNQTLTFTNAMRDHARNVTVGAGTVPTTTIKAKKQEAISLARIKVNGTTGTDEAILYFNNAASNAYDKYDSPKMFESASALTPEIFTQVSAERLVINGLNAVQYDTEIPVGFVAKQAGDYTIAASELSNFENGTRVILIDKQNPNVETELNNGTAYNFSAPITAANTDRFSLLFRAPGVTTGVDNATKIKAQVFVNANNQIAIIAPEKATYSIYNAVGQLVNNGKTTTDRAIVYSIRQAGVYVVKLTENGTELTTRVIIK